MKVLLSVKKTMIVLSVVAAMCVCATATAAPVGVETARKAASNLLGAKGAGEVKLVDITGITDYRNFYIFAGEAGEGFVIVSADDCVLPIVGYSTTARFVAEQMPPNVKEWLDDCESQIAHWRRLADGSPLMAAGGSTHDAVRRAWQELLSGRYTEGPQNTAVLPLLSTTWDQSPYYNNMCPLHVLGSFTVTGCVATATAQIMKFWNHPATGYGSHSYTLSIYGSQSADFGATTYDWNNMPSQLTSGSSSVQVNAVATLMRHVGVAVEMNYGLAMSGGSSAATYSNGNPAIAAADNALRTYFKYKSTLHQVAIEDFSDSAWRALLMGELTNGRPMLYTGRDSTAGHGFVCDGCDANGLFHFNWGWGGWCDGYYAIGQLNPASGGTGGNSTYMFNLKNVAVIGIEPNPDFGDTTTVTVSTNNALYGTVTGGGSYTGTNSSLVTLTATAQPGCRFAGWSDGDRFNPRRFYANGGSYSFVANFEPLTGDTLGYCGDHYLTSYGASSGTTYWGIKLPASVLTPGHDLTKVKLYVSTSGSYTLTVYKGTTSPTTAVITQTFNAPATLEGRWGTLRLRTPVSVDGSESLWITLSSSASHPAALTYYAGNNNSRLAGSTFTTFSNNYSFMIRGIFESRVGGYVAEGDTLSYCGDGGYAMSMGAGGALSWGIRLLPEALAGYRSLTDVRLFVYRGGTYTLNLFQGSTTTAATLIASQTYTFGSAADSSWQNCQLSTPVIIDSTLPLWVVFSNTGIAYPAATCAFAGDTNGSLIYLSNVWSALSTASGGSLNGTWLIKAVMSTISRPTVAISGPDRVEVNEPVTFTASGSPSGTYLWTLTGATPSTDTGVTVTAVWSTPGTYNVVVAVPWGSGTVSDTISVRVMRCVVDTFPYRMGFEENEDMDCWRMTDADADGYGWVSMSGYGHTGSMALGSASFIYNVGPLTPDNWAVTPPMQLAAGHAYRLSWYDGALDSGFNDEHYMVYVSTTGGEVADFTDSTLVFQTTLTTMEFTRRSVDLSSYAGQTVHVAFRHHGSTDVYWMVIDDVEVIDTTFNLHRLTVVASDTTMGTATGSGTYPQGTVVTITATAYEGYHFVQWQDGMNDAVRTVTVDTDATYTAYFAADEVPTYTITAYAADPTMGEVAGGGTYPEGASVVLTATAYEGYHFVQWQDGVDEAVRTVTVATDATYTAYFAADEVPTYTITAYAADPTMGEVEGGGTYPEGASVVLTARPFAGYRFLQWQDNNTSSPRTITVTGDATYIATFQTLEGIGEAEADMSIKALPGRVISIVGAAGRRVEIYDITGRAVCSTLSAAATCQFAMPATGVYLVAVEGCTVRRVVVLR
ncbi:MAG: C10 family peptidase [Bacteroidales bacterium]|nr:C10 family peptidase [Bacteroidales bacterium]